MGRTVLRNGAELRKVVPLGQGWKARVDLYALRTVVDAFVKAISPIASVRKLQPEELEVEKEASGVQGKGLAWDVSRVCELDVF